MKVSNHQEQTIISRVLCKQTVKLESYKEWVSLSAPGDNSRLLEDGRFTHFLKSTEVIQNFSSTCNRRVENVKLQN